MLSLKNLSYVYECFASATMCERPSILQFAGSFEKRATECINARGIIETMESFTFHSTHKNKNTSFFLC